MSSAAIAATARSARPAHTLSALARLEMRRYALHPLFWLGVALNVVICGVIGVSGSDSSLGFVIVPAAGFGVLGIVISANLTRRSEKLRIGAGVVPVSERTRSLALASACLVPFATSLVWWAWAIWSLHTNPPPAAGFPFGPVANDEIWAAAVTFGEGSMASLGGPLLGILVARWVASRAAPILTGIGVIAIGIVMQGLFEQLVRIRVISPWTYFGGPFGAYDDPNRMVLFPGSPYWWSLYLVCLCGLGLVGILLHDREQPRRGLVRIAFGVGALAVVTVLLAMWTGTPETVVNPLPSPAASQ